MLHISNIFWSITKNRLTRLTLVREVKQNQKWIHLFLFTVVMEIHLSFHSFHFVLTTLV